MPPGSASKQPKIGTYEAVPPAQDPIAELGAPRTGSDGAATEGGGLEKSIGQKVCVSLRNQNGTW